MSGQFYGQPVRAGVPNQVCLFGLLSCGVLGMVPALLLALRTRRPLDVAAAVLFGAVQLGMYVCLGLGSRNSGAENAFDRAGQVQMAVLWLLAPVHFLVVNRLRGSAPAAPVPPHPQPVHYGQALHHAPTWITPQQTAFPAAGTVPGGVPVAPAPAAPGASTAPPQTADDLQQLGELLRRQAGDGRR